MGRSKQYSYSHRIIQLKQGNIRQILKQNVLEKRMDEVITNPIKHENIMFFIWNYQHFLHMSCDEMGIAVGGPLKGYA